MTRSFFPWPSSNLVGQQACAVDDGQHVDLILFDAVDDPVGLFDQLADIFGLVLGHHAARKGVAGDLGRAPGDPVHQDK